jgi:hydrogenase maturation protease
VSKALSQFEVPTGAPEGGARLRVVGCGNPFAADDGAGLEVIRRLRACGEWECELLEMPQAGVELMEILDEAQTVVFVDAVSSGAPPGTIHVVSVPSQAVEPRALGSFTSHGWGLAESLQLRTALGRPLPRLLLVGIEIETCAAGGPLSGTVLEAIRIIVGRFAALCEIVKPERAITWKIPRRFPPGDTSFPGRSGDVPIAERGL